MNFINRNLTFSLIIITAILLLSACSKKDELDIQTLDGDIIIGRYAPDFPGTGKGLVIYNIKTQTNELILDDLSEGIHEIAYNQDKTKIAAISGTEIIEYDIKKKTTQL